MGRGLVLSFLSFECVLLFNEFGKHREVEKKPPQLLMCLRTFDLKISVVFFCTIDRYIANSLACITKFVAWKPLVMSHVKNYNLALPDAIIVLKVF